MTFGETITRRRAKAGADRYSGEDSDLDWNDPADLAIAGVAVEPLDSFEVIEVNRQRVEIDLRLYLPFGADVEPLDRVVVRGDVFAVKGKRGDWRNPYTGDEPGSVVACKRVAG